MDIDFFCSATDAERINSRALTKLPKPEIVRQIIQTRGVLVALERWGHLWTARGLYHYAGSSPARSRRSA